MKTSDLNLARIIHEGLNRDDVSITFKQLWNEQIKDTRETRLAKKMKRGPKIILASLLVLLVFGFAYKPIMEKTDYPFINDPMVMGKWQTVDLVSGVDKFNPDKKAYSDDLFIYELAFVKDGKLLMKTANTKGKLVPSAMTWTQGLLINKPDQLTPSYSIKGLNGATYMFLEEKTGSYKYFHIQPSYWVLKKVDGEDYSGYHFPITEDKIDYTFVDDPQLIGRWETVDCVDKKDQFSPGSTQWRGEILLKGLEIESQGKVIAIGSQGKVSDNMTWTRGLILSRNDKTACHYEVQAIMGNTYLFLEFKGGDYTMRGMDPGYYVFKKVQQ